MKKVFLVLFLIAQTCCFAKGDITLYKEREIQNRINGIGVEILNKNKIDKRIIFSYNKNEYKKTFNDTAITKRQIIFYDEYFKYINSDDEMAAFLSHKISHALKSYDGEWGGFVSSVQISAAPKKYELFSDKQAVDFTVKAGYNPLGLITYLNKTLPNGFFDKLLFHNSTTKRQAVIYEYIYYNYPQFIENNAYIDNRDYQNFLLTSSENRAKLKEKIESKSNREIKYE